MLRTNYPAKNCFCRANRDLGRIFKTEFILLARDLNYGKRGWISSRDIQGQEINRVLLECDAEGNGIDIQLSEHISPITWDNVILYGKYVIDESLVRL